MKSPDELIRFVRFTDDAVRCTAEGEEAVRQYKLRVAAMHEAAIAQINAEHWERMYGIQKRFGRLMMWVAYYCLFLTAMMLLAKLSS